MVYSILKSAKLICREYREHVSRYACIRPECGRPGPNDPHHDRRFGNCGVSMKPPDIYCIPLCHECHVKTEGLDVDRELALRFMLNSICEFVEKGGNLGRKN